MESKTLNNAFNLEAMELKLKKNHDRGFTDIQIETMLLEEFKQNSELILQREVRNIELADQIEYMEARRNAKTVSK